MSEPPLSSQAPTQTLDALKDEWTITQRSVHSGDFVALHELLPPDEVELPPNLTHHLLALQLTHGDRQITRFDGREYDGPIPIGTFFLQPASYPASYSWESTDEALLFLLTPGFLQRLATQTGCLNPDQIELRPILLDHDPQIEQLARAFAHEMQTQGLGGRLYTESLANCLAIHLLRHYCTIPAQLPPPVGGLSRDRLCQTLDLIHASLDQSLGLETLAAAVGLDVYYFSRLFRQSMGISPYQYVLQQRIEKAKSLLQNQALTVTAIALECGFTDSSHLARQFRKTMGMSPRDYRRQIR
ncbi:MAG: AraC family transcriptional regulator [Cyanobacteria bacterium J06627_28]